MNFDPKNRQHVLLLCAVIVAGLFLVDRVVREPLWNAWKSRSARLIELKTKVCNGEQLIVRADSLQSRWSDWRTNALPAQNASAESLVLSAFDRWSRTAGVSVSSLRPQWKRGEKNFMTLECRAEIAGTLREVTRFLYELEHDPMGIKVDSATLATRDTDGATITLSLQISGLQLLTPNSTPK
jgi:hypothetical protein